MPTFADAFWQVCRSDFPQHIGALEALLPDAEMNFDAGKLRLMEKLFARFFEETGAPWPRYHAYLATLPAREIDYDEEDDSIDYAEMGELLAQRIMATHYAHQRRSQFLKNAEDRPYWQFVAVMDGRTSERCQKLHGTIHHYTAPFWNPFPLPCESLDCRCRANALPEREIVSRARSGETKL